MLNIKKHSIFSREEKRDCEEYQDKGGVLAVWGSPGSGKTTVAVKLAKYLADRKRNVSLLLCDMTAPMLPASVRQGSWSPNIHWEVFWPRPM